MALLYSTLLLLYTQPDSRRLYLTLHYTIMVLFHPTSLYTSLYHGFTSLYLTSLYHGPTSLYLTLLLFTTTLVHCI